jgi:hypothetical protein
MKFKIGPLDSEIEQPDYNWKPIEKMSVWEFQLKATPIGIIAAILIGFLWSYIIPVNDFINEIKFPNTVIIFALCLIGTLIIHEILHLIVHPKYGNSEESLLGFWPSKMFLYALYKGEMNRTRTCIMLVMPFLLISIIPLLTSVIIMKTTYWIAYISILNAYLSCGDLYSIIWTLKKLPQGSIRKLNWWKVNYK